MKSLYLRVWITLVLVLGLFALGSGWWAQRHVSQERERMALQGGDRGRAMGELIGNALPDAGASQQAQAEALLEWSERLRLPLALDDAQGRRIAASPSFERRSAEAATVPAMVRLDDGRTLWLMRGPRGAQAHGDRPPRPPPPPPPVPPLFDPLRSGGGFITVLALMFVAVAIGAYPVVRRLTRRLEALQQGVERFGSGALGQRVDDSGRDEVASLAAAFNRAAGRIESLVQSHTHLVANASHELRSPLARLKIALGLLEETREEGAHRRLRQEIARNLRELDELIEELLLSSRLQAQRAASTVPASGVPAPCDVLGVVAEEAARSGAELVEAQSLPPLEGEERLLRRAVRNLLENARRYGQGLVEVRVHRGELQGREAIAVEVLDRGPGVPAAYAERIFEPFFRLPGHAESEGGVGLGLALVRQIAQHHGGVVKVSAREGGGSCFTLLLPLRRAPDAAAG